MCMCFQRMRMVGGLDVFYGISTIVGACGVMVIIVGNGHGDTSSNPGQD